MYANSSGPTSSRSTPSPRRLAVSAATVLALLAACGEGAPERSTAEPVRSSEALVGRWSGELRQSGMPPFRVDADIRSLRAPDRNSVSYTGIDCGGRWTYEGAAGGEYRFREVIDRGRGGACKGVGEVSLRPRSDGRLDYEFRGGGIESSGVLARRP